MNDAFADLLCLESGVIDRAPSSWGMHVMSGLRIGKPTIRCPRRGTYSMLITLAEQSLRILRDLTKQNYCRFARHVGGQLSGHVVHSRQSVHSPKGPVKEFEGQ